MRAYKRKKNSKLLSTAAALRDRGKKTTLRESAPRVTKNRCCPKRQICIAPRRITFGSRISKKSKRILAEGISGKFVHTKLPNLFGIKINSNE